MCVGCGCLAVDKPKPNSWSWLITMTLGSWHPSANSNRYNEHRNEQGCPDPGFAIPLNNGKVLEKINTRICRLSKFDYVNLNKISKQSSHILKPALLLSNSKVCHCMFFQSNISMCPIEGVTRLFSLLDDYCYCNDYSIEI